MQEAWSKNLKMIGLIYYKIVILLFFKNARNFVACRCPVRWVQDIVGPPACSSAENWSRSRLKPCISLAAHAFHPEAVRAIYTAKGRTSNNPLILHTDHPERLPDWGMVLPPLAEELAREFSPGPLTFVIPASRRVIPEVNGGQAGVAV